MTEKLFDRPPRTDVPRIIGHRGAMGHAPENTLASFRKAHELGCRWIEFDCMLTEDASVIVHHDDTLDRTTSGTGLVSETPLAPIRRLDAGSWFDPSYTGQQIPTLDEALSLMRELSMGANVEIKPVKGHEIQTGRIVAKQTWEIWPAELPPPVVSSFSLDALEQAMAVAPSLDRAILWWKVPEEWAYQHRRLDSAAAHCNAKHLSESQTVAFQEAGVTVRCYTVNDPGKADELFSWGVSSIFTDFPDRFL